MRTLLGRQESFLRRMPSAVFVAPHYDDVTLSCGGTVASLVDRGIPATMITVFGGEITEDKTSEFAKQKHARWAVRDLAAVVEQRRAENRAAAAILGCKSWDFGFPDAIYRGDRYTSDEQVFGGRFVEPERELIELIAAEVRSVPEWRSDSTLFVPLAVGGHVDHSLAFALGRLFARRGTAVYAYEDCPYAIHTPASTLARLDEVGEALGPQELVGVRRTLARRIEAIAAYGTQVPNLFRFTNNFRQAISQFAHRIGGRGRPSERFWPVRG